MFNVLRYYDFLGPDVDLEPQTKAVGFEYYKSPVGGLTSFAVELGDRVRRGDTLFEVTTPFGEPKVTVAASSGGVFWRTRRLPQVATGEYVCSVGTGISRY